MLQHYFKIAFRNLLKYKTQTLISIIGLAVGFTCFALATMWIHYEMTYDAYHEGADRMYILYKKSVMDDSGYSINMPYPAATELKRDFPEVEAVCAYQRWNSFSLKVEEGPTIDTAILQADSCFMNMFNISVLSGNVEFMYSDDKIALTEEMAMRLFGSTDVLGKEVNTGNDEVRTVSAIIKGMEHSNLSFGFIGEGAYFRSFQNDWMNTSCQVIVKLKHGVNPDNFQKKLAQYQKKADPRDIKYIFDGIQLMPLTEYHYSSVGNESSIKFYYLILFSVAGGLVILCSLFNYLSLFITRMNMRSRELSLRKVCGASISSQLQLLATEYLMMIFMSGLVGITLVELCLPTFRYMSGVFGNIYIESSIYFIGIVLLSLIALLPFVLHDAKAKNKSSRFILRKCSIVFQLVISILFIFSMTIIMKQLYYLTNMDLGWERKNIASYTTIYPNESFDEIGDKTAALPCTREILKGHWGLLPRKASLSLHIKEWEGKPDSINGLSMLCFTESETLANFYGLKLLDGEMLTKDHVNKVMINEAAAKTFGMHNPIGKTLLLNKTNIEIIGLIKDFHTTAPTIPVQPVMFIGESGGVAGFNMGDGQILVKFHEGKWNELKNSVDSIFAKDYPDVRYRLENTEEVYAKYLESETTLLKLLGFVTIVCILIAAFGIFSLVTLSCEQRRKEIAIRKVNGATIKDVLSIFVKEYMLLLIIASVVAFPMGYVFMKRWLESYIEQTNISSEIYIAIFAGIAFIIALCIGWRVWQAARQNPAEVIKSE